ncbi:MAG TPA: 30S ribosomal protein S7, partial [Candidatus Norongarragalinales archaeon]|nr:30S ribosomal protein S7 [Candidatus Norongarragalinales archaeon]
KTTVLKFVEKAFSTVETRSKKNPIQALVDAVEHSAPREEVTRVRFGGVSYQIAVDVSPQRRLDLALRNLALATIMSAFNAKTTMADALANELILASQNDANSYSVKRKNEMERVARSAR